MVFVAIGGQAATRGTRGTRVRMLILLGLLSLAGCGEGGTSVPYFIDWSRPYTRITVDCIDGATAGGGPTHGWVIRTQAEYDTLIYEEYQKILDTYRSAWYPDILADVRRDYPGLSAEESARIAEERLYQFAPFLWTKGCTNPPIDFSSLTLLGYGVHSSGCRQPDYVIDVGTDHIEASVNLHVKIVEHNYCEPYRYEIIWLLVPRIAEVYDVHFSSEVVVVVD